MSEQQAQWFQTGEEGLKRGQELAEEREKDFGPSRVWLKPGTTRKLTFIDSDGFFFNEHQLKIQGDWRNWFTCLKDFSECPLCEAGFRPSYVCAHTVIDHSKYTDKRGREVKNQKRLLVTKYSVHPKLARRRIDSCGGNMTHCVFQFTRDTGEECSTGEDIMFIKRLQREEVLRFKPQGVSDEEFLAPFNYMELFKPQSVDSLRKLVGQASVPGSDADLPTTSQGMVSPIPGSAQSVAGDADIDALL